MIKFPAPLDDRSGDTDTIDKALRAIREHLGMPIAYLSEFVDGKSVFRNVDAPGLEDLIKVGDSRSLDEVYCRHILEGRLPRLIPNTAREPLAASMPITDAVPIGSHVSIPVLLDSGQPYGMFCCLSPEPNDSLNERDLKVMTMFAEIAADQVRWQMRQCKAYETRLHRIQDMLEREAYSIAYQPIANLWTMKTMGYEALCRFSTDPYRSPDIWFSEAAEVDLGTELEVRVIRTALRGIGQLGQSQYISINASPETVLSDEFQREMLGTDLSRVLLEITEHAEVGDYDAFTDAILPLRKQGMRLAIDDAGAGHSSLRHVVQLKPDYLKLDMSLTRDVDQDLAKRAIVSALVFYSRETRAQIIAEGIETEEERDMLKLLGVMRGQGYLLGRPDFDALTAPARQAMAR